MAIFYEFHLFSILACFLAIVSAAMAAMHNMSQDTLRVSSFDVKPGAGSQQHSEDLEGFLCMFSYKAQGGTKEEWAITLSKDSGGREWMCSVERPSGHSYLFFEEFKLQISGARLEETVLERKPGTALLNAEYIVEREQNYVQQRDGKFNSQLTKVQIYAVKSPSGEL